MSQLSVTNTGYATEWQPMAKRIIDVAGSAAGLIILSPLIFFVAIRVYLSSEGPVIYSQERIGLRRRRFWIHKFRSMYIDAERNGPRLCDRNDRRITPWGRTMRRWKLDELPQLWNVLMGDMSLVGPRPEREFYINQLELQQQPFEHLLEVKPGLTSLGMIKFGYAANLDELRERMKYDLLYLEKRSLTFDMKIMMDTVKVVLLSKGN